ncbi:hypothetical protein A9P82_06660 [Arachidicoccus ginsenosidimutans]|uniref:penicillin-binding transpeptidase domain-containing protein n=1 Tax=Arachidicoccus sp. BS20 TaxID=1850526 RepID=UPI0007F14303|nr:penicillin-binding transpeptidase domain-containing protein [Arachidicoccus sp. BS20]ANI89003.1 hypothetical protein A9P82_06660 [Arachidicoccus sp. BS20]
MMRNYSILLCAIIFVFSGCTLNNVTVDDSLQKYFTDNGLKGTFALYDNSHQTFTVYDLHRYKDSSYLPGGSFDIVSSLIAIETGRVNDQNSLVKTLPDTSKTAILKDAFKNSDSAVFATIASSVGKDTLQFWLDSLHYGKVKILSDNDNFWSNDSLKITADEQLGFIEKLYASSLPFQKRTQQIVRDMMLRESNTAYSFSYKTSWNKNIGWALGWIEENKHIYFFVINAESIAATASQESLQKTLKDILTYEGFFKGEK